MTPPWNRSWRDVNADADGGGDHSRNGRGAADADADPSGEPDSDPDAPSSADAGGSDPAAVHAAGGDPAGNAGLRPREATKQTPTQTSTRSPSPTPRRAAGGISQSTQEYVRQHARDLDGQLPPPCDWWVAADVPLRKGLVIGLAHADAIAEIGVIDTRDQAGPRHPTVWQTKPATWEYLQDYLDSRDPLCPECGSGGFSTTAEGYECIDCGHPLSEDRVRSGGASGGDSS